MSAGPPASLRSALDLLLPAARERAWHTDIRELCGRSYLEKPPGRVGEPALFLLPPRHLHALVLLPPQLPPPCLLPAQCTRGRTGVGPAASHTGVVIRPWLPGEVKPLVTISGDLKSEGRL